MANPIKSARRAQKITQDELAQKLACNYGLKINRATLSKYESGKIEPPVKHLKKIAAALNLSSWTDLVPEEQREAVIIDHMREVIANSGPAKKLSDAELHQAGVIQFNSQKDRIAFFYSRLNIDGKLAASRCFFKNLNDEKTTEVADYVEKLSTDPQYQRKDNSQEE